MRSVVLLAIRTAAHTKTILFECIFVVFELTHIPAKLSESRASRSRNSCADIDRMNTGGYPQTQIFRTGSCVSGSNHHPTSRPSFRIPGIIMSVAGSWYNDLGSQMDIVVNGAQINGTYWTAVGDASGRYELIGFIDTTVPSPGGQAIGWTVVWNNARGTSNSVTTWSGQFQSDGGIEEIVAFWLLTSEQLSANDWGATQIGKNTFRRTQPVASIVAKATRQNALPHPRKLK
jgi:hypothetical protein